ncbi:hypothetical protein J6590_083770 [Homalodisca vitripennis]|nr:hypothetical protein J6590_083770 [Homalodisca vitripennis]
MTGSGKSLKTGSLEGKLLKKASTRKQYAVYTATVMTARTSKRLSGCSTEIGSVAWQTKLWFLPPLMSQLKNSIVKPVASKQRLLSIQHSCFCSARYGGKGRVMQRVTRNYRNVPKQGSCKSWWVRTLSICLLLSIRGEHLTILEYWL